MIIKFPERLSSQFEGYDYLIQVYYKSLESNEENLTLDFELTNWFEANLSAILGAICALLVSENKKIRIININHRIEDVFRRNRFLCQFGHQPIDDNKKTVITYRKYTPYEDIEFMDYINNELLSKPDFPKHSKLLGKKINESIFELFENARTHGKCKYIYTCGQYYPGKSPKRLDITIVDIGRTIKTNVNEYLGQIMSGSEAIKWAMQYGNTTKTGDVSGGLGLDIIFEFIKLNNGKIQIVSSEGYWEFRRGAIESKIFNKPFPGTIANIEFNLEDKDYYQLMEEVSLDDIF